MERFAEPLRPASEMAGHGVTRMLARAWKSRRRRLASAAFTLAFAVARTQAQPAPSVPAPPLPLLTNAMQIMARTPRTNIHPIQITATATFYDSTWPILFVQDRTAALYIPVPQANPWSISTSNALTLLGTIGPEGRIDTTSVSISAASGPWPEPARITVPELDSGRFDMLYVSLTGWLNTADRIPDHLVLHLADENGSAFQVRAPIRLVDQARLRAWLDAELEIRAVCGSIVDAAGDLAGYTLWLPGPDHVRLLRPASSNPSPRKPLAIADARRSDADRPQVRRLSVSGIVTWQESPQELYLQDESGGVNAHPVDAGKLAPGTRVEVTGVPAGDSYSFRLENATVRVLSQGDPPDPLELTPNRILRGDYWSMLVSVTGYVLDATIAHGEVQFNLKSQDHVFGASIEESKAVNLLERLQAGAWVEVTGICLPARDHLRIPRTFEIVARSEDDIRIRASAAWVRVLSALPLVGGIAVLAALAGGWALSLRYTVGRQTRQLREQLAHVTALEERFRSLFENANDLVFTCDASGRLNLGNRSLERATGLVRDVLASTTVPQLLAPEDAPVFANALRQLKDGRNLVTFAVDLLSREGKRRHLELSACPLSRPAAALEVLVIGRDTTERRQLEEQLRQAQKMEAIGQLAGGVAHDFNNILTVVKGQLSFLHDEVTGRASAEESLREADSAVDRAVTLTRQLLAFSRRQVLQVRQLDVSEVIHQIGGLLRRLLGEHVTLQFEFGAGLPLIDADRGMLEQVIINLSVNARDAMPSGGLLLLRTEGVSIEEPDTSREPEARPGRYACLTVADQGCGMDPATLARLFEPFFTTKDVGKGTGLGLATVYGIVKQHRGWIEVTSTVGEGSSFKVFLPASRQAAPAPEPAPSSPPPRGGTETLLVVEDDPSVRSLVVRSLTQNGYRVLSAANGLEALGVWKHHHDQIHLLLTDMVMPERVSGIDLAAHCLAQRPGLKVIYSSGYSQAAVHGNVRLAEGLNFLPKPYDLDRLLETVRDALDHGTSPAN